MIKNPTKEQLKTLKGIIYLITNKIYNKSYVGLSIRSFNRRYCKNWWDKISNRELKEDILKLGYKNFHISILEYNIKEKEILNKFEDEYAIKYNTYIPNGYNIAKCGTAHELTENAYKVYTFKKYPSGEIVQIRNLGKFCEENNLCHRNLCSLISGEYKYSQGFTLPETDFNELYIEKYKLKNEYRFISPENKLLIIKDLESFCLENNLNIHKMLRVDNGVAEHHCLYSNPNNPLKFYEILNSQDELFLIPKYGLRDFCVKYNLSESSMILVIKEQQKHYNGWRSNIYKDLKCPPELEYFQLKNKNGVIYTTTNLKDFCSKNNLNLDSVKNVLRKTIKHSNFWTLPTTELKNWWIQTPDNNLINVCEDECTTFAKNNNLDTKHFYKLRFKKTKKCKGFKLVSPPIDYQI